MTYAGNLKADRKTKIARMSVIAGDGSRALSSAARDEFDDLYAEVQEIDALVTRAEQPIADYDGAGRTRRTAADKAFTSYLRSGHAGPELRADGTGLSTAPNDAGMSAGATGAYPGYMIPQGLKKPLFTVR